MEWLSSLFLGAFLFGLLFSIASMLMGLGHFGFDHHGLHFGGDGGGHFGGGHDAGHLGGGHAVGHVEAGHGGPHGDSSPGMSPWNLTSLTAFIAWFGGAGYLALTGWQLAAWISLLMAGLAGLVGWGVIYLFLTRLVKAERRMDPADYRLEGTVAQVTQPIPAGKIGEIQFSKGGARRSEGARSISTAPIAEDTEVVIVRYERGIAYVEPWQEFVDGEHRPAIADKPSPISSEDIPSGTGPT